MPTSVFNLVSTNGAARTGKLSTSSGVITTPTFMPDGTRGAVKGLTPEQVTQTGVEVVLANTYHLHLQPGERIISKLGGLHAFTNRKAPILTDSGGFQVFSLSKNRKISEEGVKFKDPVTGSEVFLSPEKSIQIQFELGADMMVAFDDVTALDDEGRGRTLEAFERTHRWLERSLKEFQRLSKGMKPEQKPLIFGVVQGGLDKTLRRKSLETVQSLPVDGISIGGLSVGESRKDMHQMLEFLAPMYDPKRPHFLMGVGSPIDVRFGIEHGIDMFDCVLPTRNARHGTAWVHSSCTASYCQAPEAPEPTKLAAQRAKSAGRQKRDHVGVESSGVPSTYQAYDSVRSSASPSAAFSCNRCGKAYDEQIHLTNAKYAEDTEVIDPSCDCYACKSGFSRGFLRHQFKVGEYLAGSLVSIHNIRYLQRICEEYRSKV